MNTPQNHPDNTHDWHDALLDRGLTEILGGETPPDLSEKILAAASVDSSAVTLAAKSRPLPVSRQKHWAMFAVAACLFLSFGTWLLVSQPRYRRVHRSYAKVEESENVPPIQSSIRKLESTSKRKSETEDAGQGLSPEEKGKRNNRFEAYTNDAEINAELQRRAASAPSDVAERYRRKAELVEAAKSGTDDLSAPSRQNSFALDGASAPTVPTDGASTGKDSLAIDFVDDPPVNYPDAAEWEQLMARRKKYAAVDLDGKRPELESLSDDVSRPRADHYFAGKDLRGPGQRFRIDAAPGSEVDRYVEEKLRRRAAGFIASRDQYAPIHENPFVKAIGPDAVSTFSIDVDTASYANVRQFLTQSRQLPPPDAVRIEELINYFDYDYAGPTDSTPFAAHMEVAACPWNDEHRLARIAIKGKEIDRTQRPQSNLVFLIDVSGSMNEPNKLPLLVEGMKLLTRELGENDRVAIVVYASTEGVVLESTRGEQQETILAALNRLQAGGSTAGGAGINRAYQIALDNFIEGATNRVILCTDGDFNVGVTSTEALTQLAEKKAKTGVFLTVLGFGRGNLNDAMMESISGKGNGNYHYVDSLTEARKVLVEEMTGTLITIAKDVKIQVEFNPAKVAGYRLIGYENRMLATEDFNDDKKDAGEIGAGHTVTALYEIVPAGKEVGTPAADPLKYQQQPASPVTEVDQNPPPGYSGEGLGEGSSNPPPGTPGGARGGSEYGGEYGGRGGGEYAGPAKPQAASNELLTLKLRYKLPDADKSTKLEFPITDKGESFGESTKDFQFAAAVASFGMLLRHSQHQGETSFDAVSEIAQSAIGDDPHNYRAEFLDLVRLAKQLAEGPRDRSTTERP